MPFKALFAGIKNFFMSRVTVKYPDQELDLPHAYRGRHVFYFDKCISCSRCARACPTEAIEMIEYPGEDKPEKHPQVDYGLCVFCGYCVDVCPTDAIVHSRSYDLSSRETKPLVYSPEMLAEIPEGESHLRENGMTEEKHTESDNHV